MKFLLEWHQAKNFRKNLSKQVFKSSLTARLKKGSVGMTTRKKHSKH